jgi:LacI family transcriptional regulator
MKSKAMPTDAPEPPTPTVRKPLTIAMVAQEAGVSAATVSRILNGTAVVNDAKKKAVDDAVAKLGYVPNPMARGLAGGRTLSIGVVTQAIDSPFYGAALRGIEDQLDPAGYSPLFVSGHWATDIETRCIDVLLSRRVDGIVVLTGRLTDAALRKFAKQVPLVVTGRALQEPGLFSLDFDNFEGGRLATRHLLELGHQRVAFIAGDADHPDVSERLRGYRDALAEAGLPFDPNLVVQGEYHEESGLQAVTTLLSRGVHFTALFSTNDQMAIGAAHGLQQHGLRVPEDVSLVGFDDLPTSRYALPPLTTIHQPAYEMGQLAAEAMLALIGGNTPTQVLPAPRLIVRSSTGPLPR